PERGRRIDGDVSGAPAEAAWRAGDAHRDGHSRRQRPRLHGRDDDAQGARRTPRGLTALMLPQTYEFPAAIVLVLGGVLACFAGYRLFRIVLAVYGFILGAMIASSAMGVTNTTGMLVAALVGGIAGALILVFAYFVSIA